MGRHSLSVTRRMSCQAGALQRLGERTLSLQGAVCCLAGKDSSLVLIREAGNTHNPLVSQVSERQTRPPLDVQDTPCPPL